MARSRSKLHQVFDIDVTDFSHDGRGVGRREGKAVFVAGALPGETVRVEQTGRNRHYDEARTLEVLKAAPERVAPRCPHFGTCAGCVLQHLEESQQISAKQRVLTDNLRRIGHVEPGTVLPPLVDAAWGYRRKGRFSVRYVEKKGKVVVGFRETNPRFVADLSVCHTVLPEIGLRIPAISALVESLDGRRTLPQIEFIAGDATVALVFRHLEPLSQDDIARLLAFAKETGFAVFLQPGGVDTVAPLWPEEVPLSFSLPGQDLTLDFRPLDFIQVNAGLNGKMIASALDLLDPRPGERVLDLFCGLGNFTLPLAKRAGQVVGVEGDGGLVARARANAAKNGLANVQFHAADLAKDLSGEPWMKAGFDKLLLDPPRAGAAEVLAQLPLQGIRRIVYVSCHPGSLARDAGFLVRERGYTLRAAGAMDMFPQTAHVESIAVFEK
ncbi:MAG TPA: 23S rRNA (uracil(1939)-C(5))-methyltransferase RlmD [Arenimonas sp.]|uniref:23S rRNA (uracil(1939)-C(5))-methyltransferase RlmD n=1 Tax=Arenimonas sp. TaxID=1872635 RepID=UPI002D804534|nr:23S rRNA (uracil(1939)-C(5))-methyltransferase RlmD [Arenimonas sp.]HEU0152416.1 23S rRNA (uracil(1939)-C(5))-methyltransferase RlmD [Arenimonas sp.]